LRCWRFRFTTSQGNPSLRKVDFWVLRKKNPGVVEVAFLWGFSRFWGVFWMVNRGEAVVICVASVVF